MKVSKQSICDPTLYQWFFFLQWHSRESDEQRSEHIGDFESVLQQA